GRRVPWPRSAIRAQIPRAVPDRGFGRRAGPRHRRVLCRRHHRRARFRTEAIRSPRRHALHLRAHYPAAADPAAGPVRKIGMSAAPERLLQHPAALALAHRHRLRSWEPLPWVLALGAYFAFPSYLGFGTEVLVMVLFALSLDLALGYAGIITLG